MQQPRMPFQDITGSNNLLYHSNLNSLNIKRAQESKLPLLTEKELERRLFQRQKQIDIGKSTKGYYNYIQSIPKHTRIKRVHPITPRKDIKCSKRAWDGYYKQWRRQLHRWDDESDLNEFDSSNINEDEFDLDLFSINNNFVLEDEIQLPKFEQKENFLKDNSNLQSVPSFCQDYQQFRQQNFYHGKNFDDTGESYRECNDLNLKTNGINFRILNCPSDEIINGVVW
ncbi:hypothetical protein HDU92_003435 [Lobulomyces angularis]|nr:hypothetical protein HDU92_003435 [Lobulomyces angularis]